MVLVDSNVLVYAASVDFQEHAACVAYLESRRRDASAWFLTWPIIYEFARVMTHRRSLREPLTAQQAWAFIESVLASSGVHVLSQTDQHAALLARTLEELPELRGSILHDVHTAVLMREHGVGRIATHDTDFHRFPFLEVIDPVRIEG